MMDWSEQVENLMADGQVQEAEDQLLKVVKLLESRENAHLDLVLATALSDLGQLYSHKELTLKAEPFFERALSIRIRVEHQGAATNGWAEQHQTKRGEREENDATAVATLAGLAELDLQEGDARSHRGTSVGSGWRDTGEGPSSDQSWKSAEVKEVEEEADEWELEWDSGKKELPRLFPKPSAVCEPVKAEKVQRRGRGLFTYTTSGTMQADSALSDHLPNVSDTVAQRGSRGGGGHRSEEEGSVNRRGERSKEDGNMNGSGGCSGEEKMQRRGRGGFKYVSGEDFYDREEEGGADDGSDLTSISGQLPNGGAHILEVFGFSPALTTSDLESLVAPYRAEGVVVRWVDDTHALAVFSTPELARRARRGISDPQFRLRPFADASPASLRYKSLRELEPPVPRPPSSAHVAQRLIVGALRDADVTRSMRANGMLDASAARKLEAQRRQRLSVRHASLESAWGPD